MFEDISNSKCAVYYRYKSVVLFVLLKQSSNAKCIFFGFEHGFCIDIDMQLLFLKKHLYLNVKFANKIRKKEVTELYIDYKCQV